MQKRFKAMALVAVALSLAAAAAIVPRLVAAPAVSVETALRKVTEDVAARWPTVAQVSPDAFAAMTASKDVVVFDVREEDEFSVSHIAGAKRVDADISADQFARLFGAAVVGKPVVVYCSVGLRSTKLAHRLTTELASLNAASVANLAGGIFGWHNEARPLVNQLGATDYVHPYDSTWGRLVKRQAMVRSEPAQ